MPPEEESSSVSRSALVRLAITVENTEELPRR